MAFRYWFLWLKFWTLLTIESEKIKACQRDNKRRLDLIEKALEKEGLI